jgi:hypothetical protein
MIKYKYASVPGLESTIDDPDIRMTFKTFGWGDPIPNDSDSTDVIRLTAQEIFDAMIWIPVTERLPETPEDDCWITVLVVLKTFGHKHTWHYVKIADYSSDDNWWLIDGRLVTRQGEIDGEVTHWMPLPKLPRLI